jgi:Zn-finger nucleic acid-binding protein
MNGEKCNFDVCGTCMDNFLDRGMEEEIVVMSSDDEE